MGAIYVPRDVDRQLNSQAVSRSSAVHFGRGGVQGCSVRAQYVDGFREKEHVRRVECTKKKSHTRFD